MRSERPLYWVSVSYENNPYKKLKKLGEIFYDSEIMIHGESNVDLDLAEVVGIA